MAEPKPKRNGFTIRNWNEALAVIVILGMFVGVVNRIFKLESEVAQARNEIGVLHAYVGDGKLFRFDERIKTLQSKVVDLNGDLHDERERLDRHMSEHQ